MIQDIVRPKRRVVRPVLEVEAQHGFAAVGGRADLEGHGRGVVDDALEGGVHLCRLGHVEEREEGLVRHGEVHEF